MTWGYEAGGACLERFRVLPSLASWGHHYGVAVVGLTVALTYSWHSITVSGVAMVPAFLSLLAIALFALGLRAKLSATVLFYLMLTACLIAAYLVPLDFILNFEERVV